MITKNRINKCLSFAVLLGVFVVLSGSAQAVLLVYEPFDYETGAIEGLGVPVNATGLTGTWYVGVVDGDAPKIKGGSLTYGSLPAPIGNHWGPGAVWTSPEIEAALDPAVMAGNLDDGDELWFSFVGRFNLGGITNNNRHRLQIGSDSGNNVAIYASKINEDTGGQVRASIKIGGFETVSTDSVIFTENVRFFVGRVIFGETDTVEVYLPGPDLVKPETPAGTVTGSLDQSTFVMLRSVATNGNSGVDADEIRIGTTYGDVIGKPTWIATNPNPADTYTDVPRDVVLTWTPGPLAAQTNGHVVYFGESIDEVTDATGGNAQTAASYTPAKLPDFGKTYYWRVDEVNGLEPNSPWMGDVWSFTVEPLAYAIENVMATSNTTSMDDQGPENTVNGSGLNEDAQHSTDTTDMWSGAAEAGEVAYIQFDFRKVYQLHEMLVWNYNMALEKSFGVGLKDVLVEYSEDGENWVALDNIVFAQGSGLITYTANTTVAFDGVAAKAVRLTINSAYGTTGLVGLSEVRFMHIPTHAREPEPADGAVDVAVDAVLSWRPGREAASHQVLISTNEQAVVDGTAPPVTVTEPSYAASLDLASTHYWRVDEVNEVETPSVWPGDVWSFSTSDHIVVDDFESYTDDFEAGQAIFQSWIDGWEDPQNGGSQVGYGEAPFAEQVIVHGGKQSMPLSYDNSVAPVSEATLQISNENWLASGIKTLSLYFYGAAGNTGQLYLKINDTRVDYDGDAANIAVDAWQAWYIDLSTVETDLQKVTQLTIGIDGPGSGLLLIDDIRLYRNSPEVVDALTYSFIDLPDGGDACDGVHGGIDFGSGDWWGGDDWYGMTKCGYFSGDFVDVPMSFTLPANTHLVSIALSADGAYSYTISDGVNADIVGTTGTEPEVINTNWTSGGRTITITTAGGWEVVFDDITYTTSKVTYRFDDLPAGSDACDGVHGGIDFGSGDWWGGDDWYGMTQCGYFSDHFVDVPMSFTLPANAHLVSIALSAEAAYSYTISDGVNSDIVGTTGTTPEVISTNWTSGGSTITITTAGGWEVVFDDITYITSD